MAFANAALHRIAKWVPLVIAPDSTFGIVSDDVLAFKDPRFQRTDFCKVILASTWAT